MYIPNPDGEKAVILAVWERAGPLREIPNRPGPGLACYCREYRFTVSLCRYAAIIVRMFYLLGLAAARFCPRPSAACATDHAISSIRAPLKNLRSGPTCRPRDPSTAALAFNIQPEPQQHSLWRWSADHGHPFATASHAKAWIAAADPPRASPASRANSESKEMLTFAHNTHRHYSQQSDSYRCFEKQRCCTSHCADNDRSRLDTGGATP